MLIHPFVEKHRLSTFGDSRLLSETFGLLGMGVSEPRSPHRVWTIEGFYSPLKGRAVGGIRAKVRDQKGFASFINQRDLEVLIGIAEPGDYCTWLGQEYPEPDGRNWYGLCADEDDVLDELYEKELEIRSQYEGYLPPQAEIKVLAHMDLNYDVQELWTLLWDCDPETGISPDTRFSTLTKRWTRVEKERVIWQRFR